MSEPIVYVDRSAIRAGRLGEVRGAIEELVRFIEAQEPQLLAYSFHVDEDAERMTVVAVHPDSASLERHLDVGAEAFRSFAGLIDLEAIEVYGAPSARVVEQLERKAQDLGVAGRVAVHPRAAGFARFERAELSGP